jgi:glycosyltransferase involved in cell wall biosynthesis
VAAGDRAGEAGDYLVTGKPARGWGRVRELFQDAGGKKGSRETRANESWRTAIRDFRPDLIWIHNIQGAFKWGWSLDMVGHALSSAPVLWTLHDMWALGDGPSYFPESELKQRWNRSPLHELRPSIKSGRCVLLTPSVWLRDLIRSVDAGSCEAWPNPLDLKVFHPGPRERVRQELGLGQLDILFLATAENLADPRKGIDLLEETWGQIRKTPGLRLGLVGRNCPERLAQDPQVFALGSVAAEKRVAELMAAADLFVHPAQVESYGLVLEEAQACGTPVITFAGGGVGETLEVGKTGWLLEERFASSLASCLRDILSRRQELLSRRDGCRILMEEKHGRTAFEGRWSQITGSLEVETKRPHG